MWWLVVHIRLKAALMGNRLNDRIQNDTRNVFPQLGYKGLVSHNAGVLFDGFRYGLRFSRRNRWGKENSELLLQRWFPQRDWYGELFLSRTECCCSSWSSMLSRSIEERGNENDMHWTNGLHSCFLCAWLWSVGVAYQWYDCRTSTYLAAALFIPW